MNSGRDNIATYRTKRNSMGEPSSTVNREKGMRLLNITYHNGMAGYLMDFGFGGFIGYGIGVLLDW